MGFKKGNKYGRKTTVITAIQQSIIEESLKLNLGYSKISKLSKISVTKIKAMGYKTKLSKDKLKRIKKDSKINPSKVDAIIDLSDITFKSLCDSNKSQRVLVFNNKYKIKLAILSNGINVNIKLYKCLKNCGEKKLFFGDMLLKALSKGYKNIGIDTNAKFTDTHLNIFHLVKDYKHPYNQKVESKIGNLKRRIYANIDYIKTLDIDKAIEFIYQLAEIQFSNKLRIKILA